MYNIDNIAFECIIMHSYRTPIRMHISEEVIMTELCNDGFVADDETSETPVSPFIFNFSVVNPPEIIQLNRWKTGFYDSQIEFTLNYTDDVSDEDDRDHIEVAVHVGPINPNYDRVRSELFGSAIGYILQGTSDAYVEDFWEESALNPHRSRLEIIEALLKKKMNPNVTKRVFNRLVAALPSTNLNSMFERD